MYHHSVQKCVYVWNKLVSSSTKVVLIDEMHSRVSLMQVTHARYPCLNCQVVDACVAFLIDGIVV